MGSHLSLFLLQAAHLELLMQNFDDEMMNISMTSSEAIDCLNSSSIF